MKKAVAGRPIQGIGKTVVSGAGCRPSLGDCHRPQPPTERSFVFCVLDIFGDVLATRNRDGNYYGFAEARLPGVATLKAHQKYRKPSDQDEALWAKALQTLN